MQTVATRQGVAILYPTSTAAYGALVLPFPSAAALTSASSDSLSISPPTFKHSQKAPYVRPRRFLHFFEHTGSLIDVLRLTEPLSAWLLRTLNRMLMTRVRSTPRCPKVRAHVEFEPSRDCSRRSCLATGRPSGVPCSPRGPVKYSRGIARGRRRERGGYLQRRPFTSLLNLWCRPRAVRALSACFSLSVRLALLHSDV